MTIIDNDIVQNAYNLFAEIAPLWMEVAKLIHKAGETQEIIFLNQASDILTYLSRKEYEAMDQLSKIN